MSTHETEATGIGFNVFHSILDRMLGQENDCDDASAMLAVAFGVSGYLGYEPTSYSDATTCSDKDKWHGAMDTEMEGMYRLNVFEYVPITSVAKYIKILTSKWVYKIKPDKHKARLCIQGCFQDLDSMVSTFSPTLKSITLRLLIALAAYLGLDVQQMDVCNAFLNATLPDETPVYMHCVKGYEKPGFVIRLRKALYGLKQSPRQWFLTLKAYLERCGLVQCPLDACLFYLQIRKTVQLLVGIHVDDLLIVGVAEHVCTVAKIKAY